MDKFFIVCGNITEYDYFIRKKVADFHKRGITSATLSHFRYVSGAEVFRGISNPTGWFYGSWRNRSDIKDIVTTIVVTKTATNIRPELTEVYKEIILCQTTKILYTD